MWDTTHSHITQLCHFLYSHLHKMTTYAPMSSFIIFICFFQWQKFSSLFLMTLQTIEDNTIIGKVVQWGSITTEHRKMFRFPYIWLTNTFNKQFKGLSFVSKNSLHLLFVRSLYKLFFKKKKKWECDRHSNLEVQMLPNWIIVEDDSLCKKLS